MFYVVFYDKCRYSDNHQVYKALFLYVVAKVTEAKDKAIFNKTGGLVSGHISKHLFAAAASDGLLIYYLVGCKTTIYSAYTEDARGIS